MQKRTHNNDVVIPANVFWRDDLQLDVKVLYAIIRVLSKNDYYCCFASNEYLCDTLKKEDTSTIRRYLIVLENAKLIERDNIYVIDDYGGFKYSRALVPIDLHAKFLKKKDEMLDLKGSQKNTRKGVQNCTPTPCENAHQILNTLPCEKNKANNTTGSIYNPQTPLQGGDNAVTLVESEQYVVFGTFGNVRLTQSQRTAFSEEFGEGKALALIEQLSAYLQSGVRRIRKNADHYAMLRDWALRRKEHAEISTTKRSLVGDTDIARREYSNDDINAMFSPLDDDTAT